MPKGRELGPLVPEIFAIFGGILMAFIIALPLNTLLAKGTGAAPGVVSTIIAPLVEEPTKVLGVVYLAMMFPIVLKKKSRGIMLGAMGGLGFGFLESVIYVIQGADVFMRVWTIFGHMVLSGIVGIGVAVIAVRSFDRSSLKTATSGFFSNALRIEFLSFLILAMVLHGLSNASLAFISGDAGTVVMILIDLIALFCLYRLNKVLPEDPSMIQGNVVTEAFFGRTALAKRTDVAPAPAGARFCPYCGARVSPGAAFCSSCGKKLK